MSSTHTADDQKDLEEENYPSDSAAEQDKVDEEQLVKELPSDVTASSTVDVDEKESVLSSAESSLDPLDEEALVNSASFAAELSSAMDHVASIAKDHRAEMISSIVSDLSLSTGLEVTDEMVSSAMRTFAVEDMDIADGSTSEEEEEEEVDESLLAKEMAEALEAVRELAEDHQPAFVSRICDLYGELNDEEPSTMELHGLFSGIRRSLAEEAWSHSFGDGICTESEFEECVDAETLSEEMELALVQVRKQAQLDQEELVDFIMDCYRGLNGSDPSVEAISDILGRIKEQLAEEEREEFIELNQGGDDDEDSDYEEDADSDAEQYAEDETADIYIEGEHSVDLELESESELDEDAAFSYLEEIEDEEQLVNDSVFGELWCSAMEHIESVGREDGVSMVLQVLEQFEDETGQRASSEMVESAVIAASTLDAEGAEDEESGIESEDEEEVAIEMVEAVDRARELGALHREQLVHRICDLYAEENGEEPSLNDLYAMFGDIEASFAEEDVEDQEDSGELDADSFAAEWQSAMEHIEMAAQRDQEEMVNALCDIYCDQHGEEPSTPELYEMFQGIKASFAEEAADDVIESELTAMEIELESDDDDESEDEDDYSPDSDAFEYGVDAVDDVIYHDSEYDEEDESDSDYSAEKDAEESVYAEDAVDDVAASSESEQEEDEEKASELASDSEYSPDKSATDYFSDYQAEHEEALTSDSVSESEQESDSQSPSEDMDYDPGYDLNDYDGDFEPFQNSDDSQLDEDYSIDKDDFDYTQDQEDDFSSAQGSESEASFRGSGSEQEEDSQLAA